jgi:hypothetical protein
MRSMCHAPFVLALVVLNVMSAIITMTRAITTKTMTRLWYSALLGSEKRIIDLIKLHLCM